MKTLNPVRSIPRGQALVLSALGMVLLVLMVCMTLSFGTKAKHKMEVQIVADQAAYSTSVATARTFNVLSMVNRVMVAHMTAMLGIQSAITFASSWYLMVQTFLRFYTVEIASQMSCCSLSCQGGCARGEWVLLERWVPTHNELVRLLANFPLADFNASEQLRKTSAATASLYVGQRESIGMKLHSALDGQAMARRVMMRAVGSDPSSDWQVPTRGDKVTLREVGFEGSFGSRGFTGERGAISQDNLAPNFKDHAAAAAMASRGHPFTAGRSSSSTLNGVNGMLRRALQRINAENDWLAGSFGYVHVGHGYFSTHYHGDSVATGISARYAMSDDHGVGTMRVRYPSSWSTLFWNRSAKPIRWDFRSTNTVMSAHQYGFHSGTATAGVVGDGNHARCGANCPSAWSNFADYNPRLVWDRNDNFAQPKAPTTVYKDASRSAPDPFNLAFKFRFTPTGKTFDMKHGRGPNGGALLVRNGAGTADISRQMGYSTGITYYHRANNWAEPPNLFNPFWRAGLTRADTDRASPSGGRDIENTMSASGAPWASAAYCALYRYARYQGILPCP